jgi:hypothetical protein
MGCPSYGEWGVTRWIFCGKKRNHFWKSHRNEHSRVGSSHVRNVGGINWLDYIFICIFS